MMKRATKLKKNLNDLEIRIRAICRKQMLFSLFRILDRASVTQFIAHFPSQIHSQSESIPSLLRLPPACAAFFPPLPFRVSFSFSLVLSVISKFRPLLFIFPFFHEALRFHESVKSQKQRRRSDAIGRSCGVFSVITIEVGVTSSTERKQCTIQIWRAGRLLLEVRRDCQMTRGNAGSNCLRNKEKRCGLNKNHFELEILKNRIKLE